MNLDQLLKELAAQQPPATPADLRAEVWRLIALVALFGNWRVLSTGLALALVVGWSAGFLTAREQDGARQARAALHLDVFSPRAPGSPAKLIAYKP
ncbi:MAG: hypothetical protein JSR82_05920 [Verrucomicrobia bacterium]|nr:hypothetical protein [Verrucomicrobiota bacterium]